MLPLIPPFIVTRLNFVGLRKTLNLSQTEFWGAVGYSQSEGSQVEINRFYVSTPEYLWHRVSTLMFLASRKLCKMFLGPSYTCFGGYHG